jgi:glycosyltransferase involved in cell wall biosynthesis
MVERFRENADWITHYPWLTNQEVLEEIRHSDVGLLPSFAETYGYSVLEFQASGRPVITTDVRAFPEINNDNCGWLIPVRKQEIGGEAFYGSLEERLRLSSDIERGLRAVLDEIIGNPEVVLTKGVRSLMRVQAEHNPVCYGKRIETVYKETLC